MLLLPASSIQLCHDMLDMVISLLVSQRMFLEMTTKHVIQQYIVGVAVACKTFGRILHFPQGKKRLPAVHSSKLGTR